MFAAPSVAPPTQPTAATGMFAAPSVAPPTQPTAATWKSPLPAFYRSTFIGATGTPSLHAPMLASTASGLPENAASISASNVRQ